MTRTLRMLALVVALGAASPASGWRGGAHVAAPHTTTPRSSAPRRAFQRTHPCPSTGKGSGACPGYTVDHIRPLKRGGADAPSNMQWQTKDAAKAKDKWE